MGFRRRLAALGLLALGAPSLALAQTQRGSTRGGTEQAGYLSFTFPAGWARVDYPDGGIVYTGQIRDEVCTFSVLPLRPSSGDLLRDAIAVFTELFKTDPLTHYPFPDPVLVRGTSPLGWSYAGLQKSLGHVGDEKRGIYVFVVGLGGRDAVLVTTSKRPLVSNCFGELVKDEWPPIFYSLRFQGWNGPSQEKAAAQKLLGTWTLATGSVAGQFTFASNGRYGTTAAAQQRTLVAPNQVLATTQAYSGDGAYAVKGNTLVFTEDRGNTRSGVAQFRVEQISKDGQTWTDQFCMTKSDVPDVCYKRTR